jgi:hypothetical protein
MSNTAFGASRGLNDRESLRQTASLLSSTFSEQLKQPEQGRQFEHQINSLLNQEDLAGAAEAASQGVSYLRDNYNIKIG